MTEYGSAGVLPNYTSIMVVTDLEPDTEQRTKLALALADRFSSRLIGIAARPVVAPPYHETPVPGFESAIELEERHATRDVAQAEATFRKIVGSRNRVEWRQAHAFPTPFVLEQARAADLIVARMARWRREVAAWMSPDAGDLVMGAGRPILFTPPDVDYLRAKHVVIAWSDTREARRAVADAMPLLKVADDVTVAAFGSDERGAKDVVSYLSCHGVDAVVQCEDVPSNNIAAELVRVAEAEAADLLVCGAYGHSRASQWVFGGVTRDLLDHGRLCCLMAH